MLKGATIDLIKGWVEEKLTWNPSTCIMYGGVCDINENVPSKKILDNLGALLSELKLKNEHMDISICLT